MSALTNSWENARAWWQTAPPATRAAATGAVLLLIVALVAAVSISASPDYTPAFRGVSGKDPDAIQKVLTAHNIQSSYDATAETISVPSKDKSNAIMYVNGEASLSKNAEIPGIEELDKIGMGTDHDLEMVHIREANAGELAHILMGLDPVQTAHVAVSGGTDSSLFGTDIPPKASVTLVLKPGQTLNDEQVKGIVTTVANAFNGLTPGNVSLTDQTGTPLWQDNALGGSGVDPLIREDVRVAQMWQDKLQGLLDGTLGQHKARVTVDAEMDNDQTQVDSTDHVPATPDGSPGTPISEHEVTEKYSGGASPQGGVAGSGSNVAPSYTAGAGASGGAYTKSETTTNIEVNTRHTVTQKAPSLKKLAVAAIVDSSIPADVVASVQKTLNGAIGAVPGDTVHLVTVQQLPFDTSAAKQAQAQLQSLQSQQLWVNVAKAVAALVVAAILFLLLTRSGGRSAAPQLALAGEGANIGLLDRTALPADVEEAALEERPLRIEDVLAEMPDVMPGSRPRRRPHAPAIEEQPDLKLESVQEMINASPQSVALLLKGWMYEEARAA